MIVLNKYNLPDKLVKMVTEDEYEYTDNRYSVTEILNSTREIILKRRYKDEVVVDVSDYVNMFFGTAFHSLLEEDKETDEIRISHTLENGLTLSGRIDKFENGILKDYKTTTVFKVKSGDFEDWKKQGLSYAWLKRKNGIYVEKVQIVAFIKDFSQGRKAYEKDYPESQVFIYEFRVTTDDILYIDKFINEKLNEINHYIDKHERDLPMPTAAELWRPATVYAAMKVNGKKASALYDNYEDAMYHMGVDYVDIRKGENKKLEYDKQLRQLWFRFYDEEGVYKE